MEEKHTVYYSICGDYTWRSCEISSKKEIQERKGMKYVLLDLDKSELCELDLDKSVFRITRACSE